ncbi:ArsR/SmtB family transcription factor [Actinomadura opuntiae]|uniref:ArsR/SmtB family transcription factor n=1 Tax=Actinomadura sp. OS1-43 TaxID=604315 RepID=UPI00255A75A4|nr:ArsR family transcriptional regulator [Actinomadura sp. OS1-43]MDL4813159.1 helix-turn-helix domain-containing protein [Actinomadura sp. OS1-43]
MVLRIRFTTDDLCRVRVAGGPHPLWEAILSINSLQSPKLPSAYRPWRDAVTATVRCGAVDDRWLRAAAMLVPASGNFPDFLTPTIPEIDPEAHYETILALPTEAVRADLQRTFRRQRPPEWALRLHRQGDTRRLIDVLRRYHDLAIEPVWRQVHQRVEIDRARFARHLLDRGVEGLLAGLHPSIRWRNPVLEADYPADRTVELAGRGLLIVPAHFCWGAPVTLIDGELTPTLVCPGGGEPHPPSPDLAGDRIERLGRVLGTTRARLLGALAIAGSTTELAARLNISQAAVSQHTTALRESGLLSTHRVGQSVRHALTPLGRRLVDG